MAKRIIIEEALLVPKKTWDEKNGIIIEVQEPVRKEKSVLQCIRESKDILALPDGSDVAFEKVLPKYVNACACDLAWFHI